MQLKCRLRKLPMTQNQSKWITQILNPITSLNVKTSVHKGNVMTVLLWQSNKTALTDAITVKICFTVDSKILRFRKGI